MQPLDRMENLEDYRRLFTNAAFWRPYVLEVCRRHRLAPCEPVRAMLPGTCPVFAAGERWVVKFFGRLFEGGQAWQVERAAARLLARDPGIPAAGLAAWGELGGAGWPWPYLVYEYIPAASLGEQWAQIGPADRLRIATEVGELLRRLHALPLDGPAAFPRGHQPFLAFLAQQRAGCAARHRAWGTLPPRLLDEIETFLPPVEALMDFSRPPHLIHADLTRDHLLGRVEGGRWQTLALIDFGDAMTGSLAYELAALHLDLLGADRSLLAACLDAYGASPDFRAALPRLGLAACLLHRFNVLGGLPPAALHASSLEEVGHAMWAA